MVLVHQAKQQPNPAEPRGYQVGARLLRYLQILCPGGDKSGSQDPDAPQVRVPKCSARRQPVRWLANENRV